MMDFERPYILALLAGLPVFYVVLRRTLAPLGRVQRGLSLAVRMALGALLILALSGAVYHRQQSNVFVVFLADLSDSITAESKAAMESFLAKCGEFLGGPARAALVTFAAEPGHAVPLSGKAPARVVLPTGVASDETNIASAINMARAVIPRGYTKRVVLLSDGNETTASAEQSAVAAASERVRVFAVPFRGAEADSFLLEAMDAPAEVKKGEPFAIRARARSRVKTEVKARLFRNKFLLAERVVDVAPGASTIQFSDTSPDEGLLTYELECEAPGDSQPANNRATGVVLVKGRPRVLYLEGNEHEGRHLAAALRAEDFAVELRGKLGMPTTLAEMSGYDLLVFSDVPAMALTNPQMQLLRGYVSDLGGGFIMIGGDESFGLGGYHGTDVEKLLPVYMQPEMKKEKPSLAMVLLIDKSGSMTGLKMDLAKEAAIATTELLGTDDRVGVVAFDGVAYWIAPLQSARDKFSIVDKISAIQAGGGTNMYPALEMSYEALSSADAKLKHVIALTDGQTQPGDFKAIVNRMASDKMTLSTVAIGEGADTSLLRQMADWGAGRYYFTEDAYAIPKIFARETVMAAKSSLVEEPFMPHVVTESDMIRGINFDECPFLLGYVATKPKPTSEVCLISDRGDPVLASWRVGLGRTVAFTSDAKPRWASDWITWAGFSKFWAQVARATMRKPSATGVETSVTVEKGRATVIIDAVDAAGRYMNGLATRVTLIKPNSDSLTADGRQIAPGRYEAVLPVVSVGTHIVRMVQRRGDELVFDGTRGFVVPHKPEYLTIGCNEALLKRMAAVTGGAYDPRPADVFAPSDEPSRARVKVWPYLLAAACFLFVLDVALRRIDLGI